jgi:hypothetical protein
MPTIQLEAEISSEQLLKAVEQMPLAEFEQFLSKLMRLQAQREASLVSRDESELLQKINQKIPHELQSRADELMAKRREETLTPDEYDELLRVTDEIGELDVERVECLAELASIREVSLAELMKQLGIQPPKYV